MNKFEILTEAVADLKHIAATVQYSTGDRDLALAILDCADQLEKLLGAPKKSALAAKLLQQIDNNIKGSV
jgi:hypothetical protein